MKLLSLVLLLGLGACATDYDAWARSTGYLADKWGKDYRPQQTYMRGQPRQPQSVITCSDLSDPNCY